MLGMMNANSPKTLAFLIESSFEISLLYSGARQSGFSGLEIRTGPCFRAWNREKESGISC